MAILDARLAGRIYRALREAAEFLWPFDHIYIYRQWPRPGRGSDLDPSHSIRMTEFALRLGSPSKVGHGEQPQPDACQSNPMLASTG